MEDEQEPAVIISERGCVGVIELNRAEKFNCLSTSVHSSIDAALDQFENNSQIRSVLICATGKHFCTGADLQEVQTYRGENRFDEFIRLGHQVLRRLETSQLPVVAAVQGLCLAGGLELMLACDVVFAANDSKFGDQHAQYGLVPGWGGSQRLPRLIGQRRAMDLMFSARWIDAAMAQQWGLVNYLADETDLYLRTMEYCETLGSRSRGGLMTMKRLVVDGLTDSLEHGLDLEIHVAAEAMASNDVSEGLAAFSQKRAPQFD